MIFVVYSCMVIVAAAESTFQVAVILEQRGLPARRPGAPRCGRPLNALSVDEEGRARLAERSFNPGPAVLFPMPDCLLVALERLFDWTLAAPTQPAQDAPDVVLMVSHPGPVLDEVRQPARGPKPAGESERLGLSARSRSGGWAGPSFAGRSVRSALQPGPIRQPSGVRLERFAQNGSVLERCVATWRSLQPLSFSGRVNVFEASHSRKRSRRRYNPQQKSAGIPRYNLRLV